MKLKQYLQSVKAAFYSELSWSVLMWSTVWGVWIAFCPFVGFHTALAFLCTWLFSLNIAIVLGLSVLINNPWTMVPVYYFDYRVGIYWYSTFVGHVPENPIFLQFAMQYIQNILLIPAFSFWSFIVGGLLVATIAAVMTYSFFIVYGLCCLRTTAKD